jgi:hypothetical protein
VGKAFVPQYLPDAHLGGLVPRITTQSQFQKLAKPAFCYLCGDPLGNGTDLNRDHCPPEGLFTIADRPNYPLTIHVHKSCNHSWHIEDEKLAIVYDMLHGATDPLDGRRELKFVRIENEQGPFLGLTDIALVPLAWRIVRCAHALLYGSFLPTATPNTIHIPLPEIDPATGNTPKMHQAVTYSFADTLCAAQKTATYDSVVAYNGAFKYICTWSNLDGGQPICLFTLDVYRLHKLGIHIKDFPRAVVGSYRCSTPLLATKCTLLKIDSTEEEILYPIII